MAASEWALVVFTILIQMAVGSLWVLGISHESVGRRHGIDEADKLITRPLVVVLVVACLAFIASLFHLGYPLNAWRSVANVGQSWLSREILAGVVFVVLLFGLVLMQIRRIGSSQARRVIGWLTALVGLALVFSTAMVYRVPTQPAWNTWATPVTFFVTTVLLGLLVVGAAFAARDGQDRRKGHEQASSRPFRQSLAAITGTALALLIVELGVLVVYAASLAGGGDEAAETSRLITGTFGWALGLRLFLIAAGVGALLVSLYQHANADRREIARPGLTYLAFAAIFLSEIIGRMVFYGTHVKIGL